MIRATLALLALAACGEEVDVEPPGDYTSWKRLDVTGNAPGHTNSYRIIYANAIAADPAQPLYRTGSILVKEIRDDDGGVPGALRYLGIMRKDDRAGDGGWLFTEADDAAAREVTKSLCWRRCHVASPYGGAWYDYRK